ncbi:MULTISPECIES: hypothetical protein [unclassified Mesorhizobium]|uniref:hypothetical protein n=1 Tax=unclassified Mesorhizobium TaxID=325217 RepID=UPI000F758987|nr:MULTISPECIES: hypothetical protein [unclassified Mesorhizobium]AZO24440.1 hypothetical protein EJ070_29625 [Mesorhizobium sp. M1E.F.Ca.ET.045.02.1.1]RUW76750.1 hypothetical protein EOA29_27400 [Mesorhizobium sp. M1E.F.Ca.ET.063.01.1.1]RWB50945.1 MAG: hypothetical protein EOQ47_31510 [Mesorhizobium sp.]RWD79830.1 MAG: hypothetical protein EOS38_30935 [Mesorhizobium sp.]RWD95048.1 MAG: hypothetical protein EOS39_05140 [Mesorhizobium sp.]
MSSLPTLNNAALSILQQQRPASAAGSAGDGLVANINRTPADLGSGAPLMAEISQSMFSLDGLNVTATKVRLMERAGKEFGLDQGDYESVISYGTAVKNAVEALKRQSPSAIAEIERQLGLDQLGVSLDTLVNSIADPQSSDGDRLDAALEREAGKQGEGKSASIQPDEIGLYGG